MFGLCPAYLCIQRAIHTLNVSEQQTRMYSMSERDWVDIIYLRKSEWRKKRRRKKLTAKIHILALISFFYELCSRCFCDVCVEIHIWRPVYFLRTLALTQIIHAPFYFHWVKKLLVQRCYARAISAVFVCAQFCQCWINVRDRCNINDVYIHYHGTNS